MSQRTRTTAIGAAVAASSSDARRPPLLAPTRRAPIRIETTTPSSRSPSPTAGSPPPTDRQAEVVLRARREGHWVIDGLDREGYEVITGVVPTPVRFVLIHGFRRGYAKRRQALWGGTPTDAVPSLSLAALDAEG